MKKVKGFFKYLYENLYYRYITIVLNIGYLITLILYITVIHNSYRPGDGLGDFFAIVALYFLDLCLFLLFYYIFSRKIKIKVINLKITS